MKKIIISAILAAAMLFICSSAAFAVDSFPEDYDFYTVEGMERVYATSSYSPDYKGKADTSLVFDHRTGTACTFDLTNSETKMITVYVASRDKEMPERFAGIFSGDAGTVISVAFAATNDPDLKDWTEFDLESLPKDGVWYGSKIVGIKEGYSFYRFEFTILSGSSFTLSELALFRFDGKTASQLDKIKSVIGREKWRISQAIFGRSFFGR